MAKKFDVEFRFQQQFGKSLEDLGEQLKSQFDEDVKNLAEAAYGMAVAKAQSELSSTRQQFLRDLNIKKIGDGSYMIWLEGTSNHIEEGWDKFDMKPGMLRSTKKVASGEPWVKTAADGHKYAAVPFVRQPSSKEAKNKDIASAIKSMYAINRSTKKKQKLTSIFRDPSGEPLQGVVGIGESDNPMLDKLVKIQKTSITPNNRLVTKSLYINFRVVSELQGNNKWMHPGYEGLNVFAEMEEFIDREIDNILKVYG